MKKRAILLVTIFSLFIFGARMIIATDIPTETKQPTILTGEKVNNDTLKSNLYETKTVLNDNNEEIREFEDDFVKLQFHFYNVNIEMILENKTDRSIKFHWDQARYIDENGFKQKIISSKSNYDKKNNAKVPTIIIKKGKMIEKIVPINNVSTERYIGSLHKKLSKEYISLLIPIEIEGIVNNYMFSFDFKNKSN